MRSERFPDVHGLAEERLVTSDTATPMLVEQFRTIAATLQQAQEDQRFRSVMVTSASPADGKSLVAINLALTLAESYQRRVLLIDADLRRPTLTRVFGLPKSGGLNEGLSAKATDPVPLVQVTEYLTLLPAGRAEVNPLGGLSSDRMRRVIAEASARFDWVIVDTPPVGLLADGLVVSGMVDAAILVIRSGVTSYAEVDATVATLDRDRILGVILNGVEPATIHGRDYYRHYYGPSDRHDS